jgi:hypothetical protein
MTSPQRHDDALVDAAMTELAHTPAIEASLPDPSFLWWKAQLLRRFDAEREAAEPIDVGERVHVGAALLGASALGVGAWSHVSPAMAAPAAIVIVLGAVVALSVVATVAWHELRGR